MNINGNQTINNGDYAMQFPTIQQNTDLQQAVSALFTTKGQIWVFELLSREVVQ